MARINALSIELNEIRAANEMTLQKNADLSAQIVACIAGSDYVNGALAESERIAREITLNAELRVEKIMANMQSVIDPQQKCIAYIEQKIAELIQEINANGLDTEESEPKKNDMDSFQGEFSLWQPQVLDINGEMLQDSRSQQSEPDPQQEARREFSLRQPQELDINREMLEDNQPQQSGPDPQQEARREFSLRQSQELDINREMLEDNQPQQSEPDPQQETRREFSLR